MPLRPTPPRRLFALWALALAMLTAWPGVAAACVWNPLHRFAPNPPCLAQDQNTIKRINQANARIAGKMVTIAEKIRNVAIEINAWQNTYRTATRYEDLLRSFVGNITANPIPSLIDGYQQTPLNQYVAMDASGQLHMVNVGANFRQAADSMWRSFRDSTNLKRMYEQTWAGGLREYKGEVFATGKRLNGAIREVGNFRDYTKPIMDSLRTAGNRAGARYDGVAEGGMDAEAQVSTMSTTLSKLRGTAFEAQAQALSARMQALEAATEKSHELRGGFVSAVPGFISP